MIFKFITVEDRPTISKDQRSLYIDIIGDWSSVSERFDTVKARMRKAISGEERLLPSRTNVPIARSTPGAYKAKLRELLGEALPLRLAQFEEKKLGRDSYITAINIARFLDGQGVHLENPYLIVIDSRICVEFDKNGTIARCEQIPQLAGKDVAHFMGCHVDQDFGITIRRGNTLVYSFDCGRFEKTPKDVDSRENYFLGLDFFEWHRRIPVAGSTLSSFFRETDAAFESDAFDVLLVDLRGRHLYTDGNVVVQRVERDYVLPLRDEAGAYCGMVHFADSFFRDIRDERRPFEGGKFLEIDCPIEFHETFKPIKHAAYRDHPRGMRQGDKGSEATPIGY